MDDAYIEGHIDALQRAIIIQGDMIDELLSRISRIEKRLYTLEMYQAEGWTV